MNFVIALLTVALVVAIFPSLNHASWIYVCEIASCVCDDMCTNKDDADKVCKEVTHINTTFTGFCYVGVDGEEYNCECEDKYIFV